MIEPCNAGALRPSVRPAGMHALVIGLLVASALAGPGVLAQADNADARAAVLAEMLTAVAEQQRELEAARSQREEVEAELAALRARLDEVEDEAAASEARIRELEEEDGSAATAADQQ